MTYKFSFSIVKSLVYIVSFFILPSVFAEPYNALYTSLFVYSASKAIDYYERFLNAEDKYLYLADIGSFLCNFVVVIVALIFILNKQSYFVLNCILMLLAGISCAADAFIVIVYAVKHGKSKNFFKKEES